MRRICWSILAALMVAGAASLPAQQGLFEEAVDVRVVNVEAVVTDRDGKPVSGLSPADFRLLVDGKEVPIEFFTEIAAGEVAAAPGAGSPAAPAPAAAGEKVGRNVLVFIDDSFTVSAHRNLVLQNLERQLSALEPEDQVAVVAFDGNRLEMLSNWTGNPAAISSALAAARKRPSWGLRALAQRASFSDDITRTGVALDDGDNFKLREGAAPGGLFFPPETYHSLQAVVSAAGAALRGIPTPGAGRKVAVLLSGGWPLAPDQYLMNRPLISVPIDLANGGLSEKLYQPIVDTANRLGWTLYPVDVPGLDPNQPTAADARDERPRDMTGSSFMTSDWERATHDTLSYLAQETGGRAVLNSARLAALDKMAEDTRSYYWLGFTPAWRANDERHRIRLEPRRPGLEVRTRHGFTDISRNTETAMKTESLLLFGGSPGQEAGDRLLVELGQPERSRRSTLELPVTLKIPAESVTAVPDGKGYAVDLVLSVGALDVHGDRSRQIPQVPLRMTLAAAPKPGDILRYQTSLHLRRIDQDLVFAVRDSLSGEILWEKVEFKP